MPTRISRDLPSLPMLIHSRGHLVVKHLRILGYASESLIYDPAGDFVDGCPIQSQVF